MINSNWGVLKSVEVSAYNPDCQPFVSFDGKVMYFISWDNLNGPPRSGLYQNGWDIYCSLWDSASQSWQPAFNLGVPINSMFSERRPTTTQDGLKLFFSSDRPGGVGGADIYFCNWTGSGWSAPINLGFPVSSPFSESEPYISLNGRQLYFSSNRPNGLGGEDLWVARWNGFSWDSLTNLGPRINSARTESRPSISADGKTLFFMSERSGGFGGMDLWVSVWTDTGWSVPENVGPPINTDLPACTAHLTADGKKLYVGSEASEGSRGDEDVWVAELNFSYANDTQQNLRRGNPNWIKTGGLAGAFFVYSLLETQDGSLYAGTFPNGDVFKSTNKGDTWENTAELPGAISVYSLIQAEDGSIYAGTYPLGDVFKSTNNGASWSNTTDLPVVTGVRALLETKNGTIFAGTSPPLGLAGRIFRTTDGGTSWNFSSVTLIGSVFSLLEAEDGIMYASGWSAGDFIFKSTDGGVIWDTTVNLPVAGVHASSINCLKQLSDSSIWASGWLHSQGGYVFSSWDKGETWDTTARLMLGPVHVVRVYTMLEAKDGSIYVGFQPGPDSVILKSTNRGSTWQTAGTLPNAREVLCLLQTEDETIYAGTTPDGDIFKLSISKSGDVNQDGTIDIGDVVFLINYVFYNGASPDPSYLGDTNCDQVIDIGDIVFLISYVFYNGEYPC